MDDLLSEKEQIQQIRSWWSENGAFVVGGIVLGAAVLFGINYYQGNKLQGQQEASAAYERLVEHVGSGKLDEAESVAGEIATGYANTTYAGHAGLAMARLYMDKNRDVDAANALLSVVDSPSDDEVRHVARLRLARIYLYQEKAQDVVDLLEGEENAAFAAAYGEVLGDAYAALGRVAEAQTAYQQILLDPQAQSTIDPQLVQWKALDLPAVEIGALEDAEPEAEAAVEAEETVSGENE